ncbi:MAG: NAD(P)H-dependent oxidoreductase [Mesorhizobium sp.]|nr:NADPH-dependent FMN reductase [Mesorhizobium sp.]MBL8576704.1 NAD(P)H-dependent oxidoreductase [Mesorhizobium sp.]
MSKPKIAVIIGSTRATRFGDKPAEWIANIAKARGDFDVEIVDLRDYPLPFFEEAASSLWAPSKNEVAQKWQKKVAEYDGYIITAAEYNRGPTAVLKNALDYAYTEWNRKPVTFVGYGGVGGARAIEQLRLHAVELQMTPIRHAVHIVWGDFIQMLQQGKKIEEFEHLNQAALTALEDLAWWAKVLKTAREDDVQAKQAAE